MEHLLSLKQTAAILGVATVTVRRYIKDGRLKAYTLNTTKRGRNEYRIRPSDIEECLKEVKTHHN